MAIHFLRLFGRTPPAAPSDLQTRSEDAAENAVVARLRTQMEALKAASQLLSAGRPAEFLTIFPKLEHLDFLNAQGQSFAHEFLLEAAGQGHVEVVRALIARGAAIRGTGLIRLDSGPGNTALHAAAGRGQREMARFLLEQGADVNAMNGWGETPLHCAVAQRHLEMVADLLECGADINACQAGSDTGTPLWRAAEKLLLDEVKYLLQHGADPRLINEAKKQSPSVGAHRAFEAACRQFHRTHGEERAQLGERIKQFETLVQLLEEAERRFGPTS
jgi:ankyrin repeat protein